MMTRGRGVGDVKIHTEISIPPIPDLYALKSFLKSKFRYF